MIALIDAGNTRLKWALERDARPHAVGSVVHVDAPGAAIEALVAALPRGVRRAIVANVAGAVLGAELAAVLRARLGVDAEFVVARAEGYGIRSAYAEPERLGADRWVAMIAAHRATPGPVCVIQAGTAVTFDAVDGAGGHLGGLIFPGPRLMARALEHNTGLIGPTALAAQTRPERLLGASTDEAVGNGAMLALAAALDRAVVHVRLAAGAAPTVLLTGGDAERLGAWLETDARFSADLVLAGLAYVARHGE